jgi:antibiotic biosynthesis monooxygenase (ABM) superfamily enzyme
MIDRPEFKRGVLAGMCLFIAANAMHWFITPHPDASTARQFGVAAQLVVCLAIVWWLGRRRSVDSVDSAANDSVVRGLSHR